LTLLADDRAAYRFSRSCRRTFLLYIRISSVKFAPQKIKTKKETFMANSKSKHKRVQMKLRQQRKAKKKRDKKAKLAAPAVVVKEPPKRTRKKKVEEPKPEAAQA